MSTYYSIIMGELSRYRYSSVTGIAYATALFEFAGLKPKLQYFQDSDIIMSVFKTRKSNLLTFELVKFG